MKYIITSIEFKETKIGKVAKAVIDGKEVSIFDKFPGFSTLAAGSEIEGEVAPGKPYNGKEQYILNRSVKAPDWAVQGPANRGGGVKAAQERKEVMIEKAQERKSESIAYFNAVNSAIAMLKDNFNSPDDEGIKQFIVMWRDWFLAEWDKYNQKPPF